MKRNTQILILLSTLVILILGSFGPIHVANAQENLIIISFEGLGYSDLRMQSLFGSAYIWIPTRSDWNIQETLVSVQLNYVASPLLIPENSTMTVSAAGVPITSWRPITDGERHSVVFDVPTSKIMNSDDGFLIDVQGQLVIDKEECQTVNDPGQWIMILKDSSISFVPSLDTSTPLLDELQDEIVVKNPILTDIPPVLFVLPEEPDSVDLTVAGEVAARLSREGAKSGNPLVTYNVATADSVRMDVLGRANLVVVGEPLRNTLTQEMIDSLVTPLNENVFTTLDDADLPIEDGVIQIVSSPWSPAQRALIVSGGSPAGVALAGDAFSHSPTYNALDGRIKFVNALEPINEADTNPPWQNDNTSFAQLQFGTRTISGVGTFDELFFLEIPPGWVLLPGSQLVLDVASSPALSSEQSHVAVFLNEVPIGNIPTGENAQNTRAVFDLPIQQINVNPLGERPHKLILRLSVSNYLRQSRCSTVYADSAWIQINGSSSFVTVNDFMATPDLQAFPYPFVNDDAGATTIILPENPTADEIENSINIASTLGRYTPSDFSLEIITVDEVSEISLAQSNVIIIGTVERNSLINEFNDHMGELNNPGVYEALKNTSNGLIREGQSLWNNNRVALLVFAQTQEGVDNAILGLFDGAPPILQSGKLAVVEPNQTMRILEATVQPQLELDETDPRDGNTVPTEVAPVEESSVTEILPTDETQGSGLEGDVNPVVSEDDPSPPVLLLLLGLMVLAIPFAIWIGRSQAKSE